MSAVLKTKLKPLGAIIDGLHALREQKRGLESQVKEIETKIAEEEAILMEAMDAQGVDKSTGKTASVGISSVTSFAFNANEGFENFMKYVAKTKYFHLVQRRVSEVAVRELFESKGKVPGLDSYTKRKINLRSLPQ